MTEAFLIMLREGLEAALIVAIVLAYVRQIGRRDLAPSLWVGVIGGIAVATAIGLLVRWTVGELEGEARMLAFAAISASAAVVLTWMIFWMRRQSRYLRGEIEQKVDIAVASGHAGRGVLLVAFAAVLREGIEAALFLMAAAVAVDGDVVLVGGSIGLVVAIVIGAGVYFGGRRIPLRTFFRVTGVLLILFAGGLAAKSVFFLQVSGELGSMDYAAYNLTDISWLTTSTQVGRFLGGILGWDPRPSIEQLVVWVAYVVPVLSWFLFGDRVTPRRAETQAA